MQLICQYVFYPLIDSDYPYVNVLCPSKISHAHLYGTVLSVNLFMEIHQYSFCY